jgi:hypothetical protein
MAAMKWIGSWHSRRKKVARAGVASALCVAASVSAQSIAVPWSSHGHDAQHTGISPFPAQPLNAIRWQTPVDLAPRYSGTSLLIHYGSPLVTRANTVVIPVKTGTNDGFRVEGRNAADGSLKWMQATDYSVPPSSWGPSCGIALTPKNRLYLPGAGGTVYFRDAPDAAISTTGQIAFYGLTNYLADASNFNSRVKINTPITSDRYGNIFFGFQVFGPTTPPLQSGIARISVDGDGSWIAASNAVGVAGALKVLHNCAPALANDHKTLYIGVRFTNSASGYLGALDSRTLAPLASVRLKDVLSPAADARLSDIGTSSPTVGPDGDVYFGVVENAGANHGRGWMLHFDKTLSQAKVPGAFGWDVTPSIVPSSSVPAYQGFSKYLILTKYNNYASGGGDGVNRMAVLDPNDTMTDPISGATVMKEVITVTGLTRDEDFLLHPEAVKEWCINTVAVDPFTRSAIVNSEDGKVYRWDFVTNSLTQILRLTGGLGEAYTPTVIGVDGTAYVIANATLFAIGE